MKDHRPDRTASLPRRLAAPATLAGLLLLAATPAPALTLRPAPLGSGAVVAASGSLVMAATVAGSPASGHVEVLRAGAVIATGRAGEPIGVPAGTPLTARVSLDEHSCTERTLPGMAVGARATRTAPVPFAVGRLRVRIFNGGVASGTGLAEVFRSGEAVSCAHTGDGGILSLGTGDYRVRVRRFSAIQWFDVTVRDGVLVGVTANF